MCICVLKPRLHDETCCQTGCQTRLTTGLRKRMYRVYSRLSNRLYNPADNRLNEQWLFVQHGCHRLWFDNQLYRVYEHSTGCQTGLTTGWQPVGCLFTRYSRLSNRLYTRFDNRLYSRFDNRLYRVNGVLTNDLYTAIACDLYLLEVDFWLSLQKKCPLLRDRLRIGAGYGNDISVDSPTFNSSWCKVEFYLGVGFIHYRCE